MPEQLFFSLTCNLKFLVAINPLTMKKISVAAAITTGKNLYCTLTCNYKI
jgi:hypothetical protein